MSTRLILFKSPHPDGSDPISPNGDDTTRRWINYDDNARRWINYDDNTRKIGSRSGSVFAIPTKKKKLARLEDEYILLRETLEELIRQSLSKGLIEEKEVHLQMGCFDQGLFYWYWALEHDFIKIFRRYPGRAWEIGSSLPSDHEEINASRGFRA